VSRKTNNRNNRSVFTNNVAAMASGGSNSAMLAIGAQQHLLKKTRNLKKKNPEMV
jgi:hypothetical protein